MNCKLLKNNPHLKVGISVVDGLVMGLFKIAKDPEEKILHKKFLSIFNFMILTI
jgi:hypothetical protein